MNMVEAVDRFSGKMRSGCAQFFALRIPGRIEGQPHHVKGDLLPRIQAVNFLPVTVEVAVHLA